ncbi:MAG: hypothetical protein E7318_13505 [Clostridiales bacterium]|nr:hypothetical protein [Clostridiales bacterium]
MERYLRRNRLSEILDDLGLRALFFLLATGWFTWLWGLNLPTLLAGAALGMLMCTARREWRKRTVHRREKALRSRLGAELMLEDMLMAEPKAAHFRAALLLAEKWPITLQSLKEEGVLCRQGEETLLIQCIRMPEDGELSEGDLIAAQRAVRRLDADRAVLCPLGKAPPKIMARAEGALVPLRIIPRSTLLALAGHFAPATDEQLIELGKRRRRLAGRGGFIRLVFRREKARRYHLYGQGMLILYIISGVRLYAVPGMVCLTLAVMSRWGRPQPELL